MRVDLRLQGLDLGAGRELGLQVKLVGRELRGEKRAQALANSQLRAVDVQVTSVVELDRAHGLVLHQQGDHHAVGTVAAATNGAKAADVLAILLVHRNKGLHALALEHLKGGAGVLGAGDKGRVDGSRASQDMRLVGNGYARGVCLGQEKRAYGLGVVGREAAAQVLQRAHRHAQGALGCLGA